MVRDPTIVSIRMFDEENGWAVSQERILRTADGGATWHDVSPKAGASFGYAVSAYFLDTLHAWVLVPNSDDMLHGILYRSGDGGLTWSESPVPFGGGSMQFLDAKQGWMMADLGAGAGSMAVSIFQTADAGATWTRDLHGRSDAETERARAFRWVDSRMEFGQPACRPPGSAA